MGGTLGNAHLGRRDTKTILYGAAGQDGTVAPFHLVAGAGFCFSTLRTRWLFLA